MKTERLVANRSFAHEGRMLLPGEAFAASPRDAALYRAAHFAELEKFESEPPKRVKRKYQRRDMVAE